MSQPIIVSTIEYDEETIVGLFATRDAALDDLIERFEYLLEEDDPELTRDNVLAFATCHEAVDIAEYANPHDSDGDPDRTTDLNGDPT